MTRPVGHEEPVSPLARRCRQHEKSHMLIETERLLLRPLIASDLEPYAALMADAEVVRHLGGKPYTRDETARALAVMMDRFANDGYGQVAIVRKDDRRFLGRCGLLVWELPAWRPTSHLQAYGPTETEIAWRLGRAYWGHGYATEAAAAVRDYAFATLDLTRLISLVTPANSPSIAVARRIGMELEKEVTIDDRRTLVYATAGTSRRRAHSRLAHVAVAAIAAVLRDRDGRRLRK